MSEASPPAPGDQPNPYYAAPQTPPTGGPYGGPYAPYSHWGKRVLAYLVDAVASTVASIPFYIGYFWLLSGVETTTDSTGTVTSTEADINPVAVVVMVVGIVTALGFFVWNSCIRQGRTGYSIGKGVVGIKLVRRDTEQPMGAGMSFVRQLAHVLDSLPCYLGYLWPLWDAKRQTFADKVTGTVVLDIPQR